MNFVDRTIEQVDARATLSQLHERRAALGAEVESNREKVRRLEGVAAVEASAKAALASFNAAEAEKMKAWAASAADKPPELDEVQRQKLEADAHTASSRAAAARQAIDGLHAAIRIAMDDLNNGIDQQIDAAISDLVLKAYDDLIPDFEQACRESARIHAKLRGANSTMVELANNLKPDNAKLPALRALEAVNTRMQAAYKSLAEDSTAVSQAAISWRAFAAKLKIDPDARFDDLGHVAFSPDDERL